MARTPLVFLLTALLVTAMGCKKDHPSTPVSPPSSVKDITQFEIRKTDNPNAVANDVFGVISNDTISITMSAQAPLTSLVPLLTFDGKSISPANGSPQNFTSGITYTVTAADGSTKSYLVTVRQKGAIYVSTSYGKITSLDPVTLNPNWTFQSPETTGLCTPTTGDGLVFALNENALYAVSAIDGTMAWKITYTTLLDTFGFVYPGGGNPVPVFSNGVLYGSFDDGTVRAIDARTGSVKWSLATNIPFVSSPTLFNGSIYVGSLDGYLYSINAATGTVNWKFKGSGDRFTENPLVYSGMVYIGTQGKYFYAVQATSGRMVWADSNYFEDSSPTAWNGNIYVAPGPYVSAINASNDAFVWLTRYISTYSFLSSPIVANGIVYDGCLDYNVDANDATTGAPVWSYNLGGPIYTGPVVAYNKVYATNSGGIFVVLNATDGSLIASTNLGAYPSSVCLVDSAGNTFHPSESGEQN